MARLPVPGTAVERLAHDLFDGATEDPLAEELFGWLAESPRFRAFAEAHREKIRKKLRGALDAEARRDVRAELQAATCCWRIGASSSRTKRTDRSRPARTSR